MKPWQQALCRVVYILAAINWAGNLALIIIGWPLPVVLQMMACALLVYFFLSMLRIINMHQRFKESMDRMIESQRENDEASRNYVAATQQLREQQRELHARLGIAPSGRAGSVPIPVQGYEDGRGE